MATIRKFGLAAAISLLAATGCMNELDPMTNTPPAQDPPAQDPPAQDPPAQDPPVVQPPVVQPPVVVTPPVTPPATSTAKPLFEMNVAPILLGTCGMAACHGGVGTSPIKFVSATPATAYDTVLGYSDKLLANDFNKTRAQILLKIAAGHYGVVYTPAQKTSIEGWLDAEVAARASGGGQPTTNVRRQLMSQWSGCMTLTDWNTEGVAQAWANKNTNEGTCQQCHVNAQGWLASVDSQRVFDILSTQANPKGGMFMEMYFVPDTTTDAANPKMVINRDGLLRAAGGAAQHPRFTVDGDAYSRLTRFYDKTMAKKAGGTCAAPKFTP